jgi:hypothetical protein
MNQHRKAFPAIIVSCAIMLLATLVSCSNPAGSSTPNIVGTWENVSSLSFDGVTVSTTIDLTFTSDSKYTSSTTSSANSTVITSSGTWSGSASPYTLTSSSGSTTTATVSGSSLTISGMVFTKK